MTSNESVYKVKAKPAREIVKAFPCKQLLPTKVAPSSVEGATVIDVLDSAPLEYVAAGPCVLDTFAILNKPDSSEFVG